MRWSVVRARPLPHQPPCLRRGRASSLQRVTASPAPRGYSRRTDAPSRYPHWVRRPEADWTVTLLHISGMATQTNLCVAGTTLRPYKLGRCAKPLFEPGCHRWPFPNAEPERQAPSPAVTSIRQPRTNESTDSSAAAGLLRDAPIFEGGRSPGEMLIEKTVRRRNKAHSTRSRSKSCRLLEGWDWAGG